MHRKKVFFWICFLTAPLFASAPVGIPRQLAQFRASEISDVRYRLDFNLDPHANITSGHEQLSFKIKSLRPVLIDFREGTVSNLK